MQPSLRSHRIHIHWALLIIRQPLEQKRKLANYLLSADGTSFGCVCLAGCMFLSFATVVFMHLEGWLSSAVSVVTCKKKKKRGWYMVFGKVDTSWLITVVLQKPLHMITTDWRLLLTLCLIDYFTLCFCYPLSPDANWSFIQNVFCKQEKTLWPLIQTKSEFITGTLFPPIVHKMTDFSVSRDCRCSKICSASECNGTDTVNCIRLLFSRKFKTIFLCCR